MHQLSKKACCNWRHRKQRRGISWQIGLSGVMRGLFANGTGLNNTINSNFHPVEQFVLFCCGSYLTDYARWYGLSPFDSIAIAADLGICSSVLDWPYCMGCGCLARSAYPVHGLSRRNPGAKRVLSIQYFFPPHNRQRTFHGMRLKDIFQQERILIDWNRSQMSLITLIMHLTMR